MDHLSDSEQRKEALNIEHSYLVQAPAGSGKTEVLIQRYLKLLGDAVHHPEEIIAITFTRKAASEMRQRIIASLTFAKEEGIPIHEHQTLTYTLAKKVLDQDKRLNWNLIENPNRLKIMTIDALCARLTKQMPILSQFGSLPTIEENPATLFENASDDLLASLEEGKSWTPALITLLNYLDNDSSKIKRLFTAMLSSREQWLPYILEKNPRHLLEQALEEIIESQLEQAVTLLNQIDIKKLLQLLQFAAEHLSTHNPSHVILGYQNQRDLFPPTKRYLTEWQALANFLVTESGTWRNRFSINEGFPSQSSAKNAEEKNYFASTKDELLRFVTSLQEIPGLLNCLNTVRSLPAPYYTDEQWEILNALVTLLPILVAHLHVLFKKTNSVDYTEISLRALQSLGALEAPTELSLILDYQIKHILVDEFQDTSVNQFRLLELLTSGWEAHDKRTLFLVGDTMQSIYRFRKAEVGLFIKARDYGINQIKLRFLKLSVNFRSTPEIVDWNNRVYSQIFPMQDDLALSAVSFSKSIAFKTENINNKVQLHPLLQHEQSHHEEPAALITTIQKIKETKPLANIAILVLARSHLVDILAALKNNSIPYRAIELESLANHPVIQDLLSLTKALLNLSDVIAWNSILRAPWCGLCLADLLVIAQHAQNNCILNVLLQYQELDLSQEGKLQLKRITPLLHHAWISRNNFELSYVIEATWLALGGSSYLKENDLLNAKRYFESLEKFESKNNSNSIEHFERTLQNLTAVSQPTHDYAIEVMTIHKAKGLEFDVVLIPGLDKSTRGDDHELLVWQEVPSLRTEANLLLAPIKSMQSDPLYDYIRSLEKIKLKHELNRLLYVATTRAREELHLFFSLEAHPESLNSVVSPKHGSLLAALWPVIQRDIQITYEKPSDLNAINVRSTNSLRRLTPGWQNPLYTPPSFNTNRILNSVSANRTIANWSFEQEKIQGTIIHKLIETVAKIGIEHWQNLDEREHARCLESLLSHYSLPKEKIAEIHFSAIKALETMFADPKGRWILTQKGSSEYAIHYSDAKGQIQKSIIDRILFEKDVTWIIDFKSSRPNNSDQKSFLQQQKELYQPQLMHYQTLLQTLFNKPVRAGLYFTSLPAWIEYDIVSV